MKRGFTLIELLVVI
ncbi:MAG: prepilin-type N-terminal cleavage/methylation domain-containing protein, partial [Armatimonadota bacterium]